MFTFFLLVAFWLEVSTVVCSCSLARGNAASGFRPGSDALLRSTFVYETRAGAVRKHTSVLGQVDTTQRFAELYDADLIDEKKFCLNCFSKL